jgi:hypothetical protein
MSQEKNMNKSIQAINRQQTKSKAVNINNKFTSVQKRQTREMKMESFIPSMVAKENVE